MVVGVVMPTASTLFVGSDNQVLNIVEGDRFVQLIQNGEDINNETLTFTVSDKGKGSSIRVGLSIPTTEGTLVVELENNEDTQKNKNR